MSRVLKIVSVAVLIFLGFMWVNVLTKSCNSSKEIEFPNQKAMPKQDDEFGKEDFFEEKDTVEAVNNPAPSNKPEPIDYNEIDKTIEENKKVVTKDPPAVKDEDDAVAPAKKSDKPSPQSPIKPVKDKVSLPSTPSPTSAPSNNTKGSFVVIAGNYLVEGNADAMIKRLKKAGFSAEKVIFNLSEFHTVIVGRYADQGSAAKTATNLKAKGFDAYVQKPK